MTTYVALRVNDYIPVFWTGPNTGPSTISGRSVSPKPGMWTQTASEARVYASATSLRRALAAAAPHVHDFFIVRYEHVQSVARPPRRAALITKS